MIFFHQKNELVTLRWSERAFFYSPDASQLFFRLSVKLRERWSLKMIKGEDIGVFRVSDYYRLGVTG